MPDLPSGWMPVAPMKRVIVHWTAGSYTASEQDKEHYHFLIQGDGCVVRGSVPVNANVPPLREGRYAAHTLNTNAYSIGVSICCMANAVESPFDPGHFPMKEVQFKSAINVVAALCNKYNIPVTEKTVLTHAEVQPNLGIKQRGKWDITHLAFDPSVIGARAVGDKIRQLVKERL